MASLADLPSIPPRAAVEVWTVADDEIVLHHADGRVEVLDGLRPDVEVEVRGVGTVRTLARPGGELLCRFGTVNDVHFGELECGRIEEYPDLGPVLIARPGDRPYPETMNAGAIGEMQAASLDAVIVKGDLTCNGSLEEYEAFLAAYGVFGLRMHHVRGNHDAMHGLTYAAGQQRIELAGCTVALLDTVDPGRSGGTLDDDQLDWLDEVAVSADADRHVIAMGHHHPWDPASNTRPDSYFGISPTASEGLVAVLARRERILGWFAGHTHRNRRRTFGALGDRPIVEVGCTKDFPGSWAEYRVFEGGVLQVHRRISTPAALAWSDGCRAMVGGLYPLYASGSLADRCFAF